VRRSLLAAALSFPLLTPLPGWAVDDAGLRRCREIPQSTARLACYDALPLGPAPLVPATPHGAAAAPSAAPKPPSTAAPPPPPATTARPEPPAPSPEAGFGLQKPVAAELPSIESFIPGAFDGWGPNSQIRLANGQVWQIVDGTSRFLAKRDNPKVTVRRGAFNSFFLDFEGDNRSPQVRRVQ
jgi:hypothetical protein